MLRKVAAQGFVARGSKGRCYSMLLRLAIFVLGALKGIKDVSFYAIVLAYLVVRS